MRSLMVIFAVILQVSTERILVPPKSVVAPKDSNVTFDCSATALITWGVFLPGLSASRQVGDSETQAIFANYGIFAPLPLLSNSRVTIAASPRNNGTRLECLVGSLAITDRSDVVTALFYGETSPPTNLTLTLLPQHQGILLTWIPGFSLDGEEVTFIIISHNLASDEQMQFSVNTTSYTLIPPSESSICPAFNVTVYSENRFSRSISGVSEVTLIPGVPTDLVDSITTTTSLEAGSSITFSFNDPSPCQEYRVHYYTLEFVEEANFLGMEPFHAFNVSRSVHNNSNRSVSLVVSSRDGLLPGRQYNATISAFNAAGSSQSSLTVYTTGLQSSKVSVNYVSSNVIITCSFARGANALGCQVSIGTSFHNITREPPDANIAFGVMSISLDDYHDQVVVTVAEILPNGLVSSIIIKPTFVIMNSPTSGSSTVSLSFPPSPPENRESTNHANKENYVVIGTAGGVGAIILLFVVGIIGIAVCRKKGQCYYRRTVKRSERASKILAPMTPNPIYAGGSTYAEISCSTFFKPVPKHIHMIEREASTMTSKDSHACYNHPENHYEVIPASEDAYTVMDSAGAVAPQTLKGGSTYGCRDDKNLNENYQDLPEGPVGELNTS